MKKKRYFPLLLLLVAVLAGQNFMFDAYASEFTFAVNTVIPDNQVDKSKTYFDLMMEPGEEQVLEIELRNDTDEEAKIDAVIRSATTNLNGVVEYGDRDVERDSTLEYALEDLIRIPEEIIIPANSTYVLELELTMPDADIEGILAGGITLQEADDTDTETAEENTGMSIQNKYAYVVGIVLRTNEQETYPELVLNDVFAGQVNARNVINANIQNIIPMYMNSMSVEARITRKGEGQTLYEEIKDNMQMAPNSNFDFPVPLNGEKMEAGEYTIYLTVESMGETWQWEKDFIITSEEAEMYNASDVSIPEDNSYLYLIIGAALLVIVILIVIIISSRKKAKRAQAAFRASLRSGF